MNISIHFKIWEAILFIDAEGRGVKDNSLRRCGSEKV